MRSRILTCSLVALSLSSPTLWAQSLWAQDDSANLAYKIDASTSNKYKVRFSAKATGLMPLAGSGEMHIVETGAAPAEADGALRATQDTTRVVAKLSLMGQEQEHDTDSGKPADGTNMVATAATGLKGKCSLELKPSGEVTSSKSEGKGGNSPLRQFIGAQFFPYDLLRLPEAAIKVGESWSYTMKQERTDSMTGAKKTISVECTYTLRRIVTRDDGEKVANIDIVIKPGFDTMPGSMGAKVTKAEGKGKATFSISKGHVRTLEYDLRVEAENEFAEGDDKLQTFIQSINMRRSDD